MTDIRTIAQLIPVGQEIIEQDARASSADLLNVLGRAQDATREAVTFTEGWAETFEQAIANYERVIDDLVDAQRGLAAFYVPKTAPTPPPKVKHDTRLEPVDNGHGGYKAVCACKWESTTRMNHVLAAKDAEHHRTEHEADDEGKGSE